MPVPGIVPGQSRWRPPGRTSQVLGVHARLDNIRAFKAYLAPLRELFGRRPPHRLNSRSSPGGRKPAQNRPSALHQVRVALSELPGGRAKGSRVLNGRAGADGRR